MKGDAGPAFAAMAAIDVAQAAVEWPFVDEAEARCDLDLMRSGLAEGIDADGLVWEYRRLFIGPAPKPAPPWGSVYTDRECVVFGATTLELRAWMRSCLLYTSGELALPAARPYYTKTAVLRKENRCTTIGVARDLRQRVSKRASAHCSVSIPASRWGRSCLLYTSRCV